MLERCSASDYHILLQRITELERKICRLEVNSEVNGPGENDLTLPWKNRGQEDANTKLIGPNTGQTNPNQATKSQEATVLVSESTSGSADYISLGARPKENSFPRKKRDTPPATTRTQRRKKDSVTDEWKTSRGKKNITIPYNNSLKLTNRFAVLSEPSSPADTSTPSRAKSVITAFTNNNGRKLQDKQCEPQTLIIGDGTISQLRNVTNRTKIFCFPEDKIADLTNRIKDVLATHGKSAKSLIIHAQCSKDIALAQSELLKKDISSLLAYLCTLHLDITISGPIPPIRTGDMNFSRIWSLNRYLSELCRSHSVRYVENFTIFWGRNHLFKQNNRYATRNNGLNRNGFQLLSANLFQALRHPAKDKEEQLITGTRRSVPPYTLRTQQPADDDVRGTEQRHQQPASDDPGDNEGQRPDASTPPKPPPLGDNEEQRPDASTPPKPPPRTSPPSSDGSPLLPRRSPAPMFRDFNDEMKQRITLGIRSFSPNSSITPRSPKRHHAPAPPPPPIPPRSPKLQSCIPPPLADFPPLSRVQSK